MATSDAEIRGYDWDDCWVEWLSDRDLVRNMLSALPSCRCGVPAKWQTEKWRGAPIYWCSKCRLNNAVRVPWISAIEMAQLRMRAWDGEPGDG